MSFKVEIPEIFYGSFIYWYETMVFTSVWNSFSWGKCFFKEFFMGINFIICIEILRPWNVLLTNSNSCKDVRIWTDIVGCRFARAAFWLVVPPILSQTFLPREVARNCHSIFNLKLSLWWGRLVKLLQFLYCPAQPLKQITLLIPRCIFFRKAITTFLKI